MNKKRKTPQTRLATESRPAVDRANRPSTATIAIVAVSVCTLIVALAVVFWPAARPPREVRQSSRGQGERANNPAGSPTDTQPAAGGGVRYGSVEKPRFFDSGELTMVWDSIREDVVAGTFASKISNIAPEDYVGPSKCIECHADNHADWSKHPHRWMNAVANQESVVGDFSGEKTIQYRGGTGRFVTENGQYKMYYQRDDLKRSYVITQTIGSRFYQYYIGRGLEGPEPEDHNYYSHDHVLPFGFWIDRGEWVPIVHVADEPTEDLRWEPVENVKAPTHVASGSDVTIARGVDQRGTPLTLTYAQACNFCHTTFALGDMYVRLPQRLGKTVPKKTYFALSNHVKQSHPNIWDGAQPPEVSSGDDIMDMTGEFIAMEAKDEAATLGVSCEACHLGCREHANNPKFLPPMVPLSPNLRTFADPHASDTGRTAENINTACSRCHAGGRPTYAAGMATWNSTEHSDAMKGSCYSQLSCAHCHDPHKATGKVWPKTPEQDDASCTACHQEYLKADFRQAHTHHAPGSGGDRCMNCHMPRINEGMQDVVRTHTIFSPTQADMIETNQPNACNLCHLDKSINWTLDYLSEWYGKNYSQFDITSSYLDRKQPTGIGWLASDHEATRLVAAEAAARENATWMVPAITTMLDDPYLLNRQFAQTNLEKLLSKDLPSEFGYWFYMTPEERKAPIAAIRQSFRK